MFGCNCLGFYGLAPLMNKIVPPYRPAELLLIENPRPAGMKIFYNNKALKRLGVF